MADNVGYSTGSGVSIAADDIGGVLYQRVKVVLGADGASDGDVNATNPVPVSGTVSVSGGAGTTVVSGTVTVLPGVSVSAVVSGTVTVAGAVAISGTGLVSVVPGFSVTIQQGASVSAQVSGTVSISGPVGASGTVSILNIVPVVTQASVSVTGLPVWMNPTQAVVVNTIAAGFSVNALVTGAVSISAIPAVSISVSAVLGTIITQLGTQVVTVVPGLSVSAQVSGAVSISAMPAVSISVSAVLGTIITQLGTQVVTVVPGLSVSAVVSGTVSVSGLSVTAAGPSVAAPGIVVWIAGGQSSTAVPVVITGTVTAGAGTTVISGTVTVGNALYTSTAVTTGTAQAVWIMNPTTVTVTIAGTTTGTVSILNVIPVVTQASASVTGLPVWLAPSQTIGVFPKGDAIGFSFTLVSAATVLTPALCDVAWLGTTVQTSMYVVPAGRTLQIQAIRIIVQNTAASIGIVRGEVFVRMSLSSSVTVGPVVCYANAAAMTSATNAGGADGYGGNSFNIAAGYSVGLAYKVTGGTGHIIGAVIQGVLF